MKKAKLKEQVLIDSCGKSATSSATRMATEVFGDKHLVTNGHWVAIMETEIKPTLLSVPASISKSWKKWSRAKTFPAAYAGLTKRNTVFPHVAAKFTANGKSWYFDPAYMKAVKGLRFWICPKLNMIQCFEDDKLVAMIMSYYFDGVSV